MSLFATNHPYTAVSVHINQLTAETYDEDDLSGIPELIEVIKLQDSGPTEAARAIRKKLKYGNVHRQLRALTILNALVENAGKRFQKTFADPPLLERLRALASDPLVDADVRKKARIMYANWAEEFKDIPYLQGVATIYRSIPKQTRPLPAAQAAQARPATPEEEDEDYPPSARRQAQPRERSQSNTRAGRESSTTRAARESSTTRSGSNRNDTTSPLAQSQSVASTSSAPRAPQGPITLAPTSMRSKDEYTPYKTPKQLEKERKAQFNFDKEKPVMIQNIASASVAATNLQNALKLVNREKERVSDNAEVMNRFETCKLLRRNILRYIQFVEAEQWLGGLIHANEELVQALTVFELLDKAVDKDSDSETETSDKMSKMKISDNRRPAPPPPVQTSVPEPKQKQRAEPPKTLQDSDEYEDLSEDEVEDDPNDPFGNAHALPKTPAVERKEPKWAEV